MTLIIISLGILVGGLISLNRFKESITSISFIVLGALAFMLSSFILMDLLPQNSSNFYRAIEERHILEAAISKGVGINPTYLIDRVSEYNNFVINSQKNSESFIIKDYYSNDIPWEELNTINFEVK